VYRVETYSEAMDQIAALPNEALAFYAQVLGVLELAPWNGVPYNKGNPDGAMRQLMFGPSGVGVVTYLVLEDQRRVT
jgi:hypothetical protein